MQENVVTPPSKAPGPLRSAGVPPGKPSWLNSSNQLADIFFLWKKKCLICHALPDISEVCGFCTQSLDLPLGLALGITKSMLL